jgi:two-component system cell cycle sensor histidine kinase/response regulator CckA
MRKSRRSEEKMETILLVDDEPAVLKFCQHILKLDGYTVLHATSGEEALELLRQNKAAVNLALLDVMMPGMNGVELASRIGAANPDIPIILMTGYGPEEIASVVGDKSHRIIWKPFQADSLRQMIENVLNNSAKLP